MFRKRNGKIRIRISAKAAKDIEEVSVRTRTPKSDIGAAALEFGLPKILSGELKISPSLVGPSPETE
ncbi:MAG: hypothetical protein WCO68_02620 [Verrucomicrobiota bacterium]